MAVESLECCLSRAIGSSCTGETQTYSARSLAVLWASKTDNAGMSGVLWLQCGQSKPAFPSPLA